MTNEELLSVAEIVERLSARFHKQADDHEAKMVEHRAAFGARTKADAETIDRLHTERDALRAEVAELKTQLERLTSWAAKNQAARETLQTEIERLKSQTPKHPVKVGEWVRRLTGFNTTPAGEVARVTLVDDDDPSQLEYEVVRPNGQKARWSAKGCEPCDSPEATAKLAPKVGDTVRLVTHPDRAKVAEHLQLALQWPWIDRWGVVGQTGKVVKPLVAVAGAVAVALADSTVFARWPIDCLEVVAEATHDTEAGKAAAEAAVKTEPDEIKVGDVAKVRSASGNLTAKCDVGQIGEVLKIDSRDGTVLLSGEAGWVDIQDVRKVTT